MNAMTAAPRRAASGPRGNGLDPNTPTPLERRHIPRLLKVYGILCLIDGIITLPLIVLLIGEKWLPAVGFLQIMCFYGMLYPLHSLNLNMLQVKGRSDLFLRLEVIKKIIAVGPLMLGVFVGIKWMLAGSVVTSFVAYFLNSYYSADLVDYPTREQITDWLPTFLVSLLVSAAMWRAWLEP